MDFVEATTIMAITWVGFESMATSEIQVVSSVTGVNFATWVASFSTQVSFKSMVTSETWVTSFDKAAPLQKANLPFIQLKSEHFNFD